MAEGPRIHWTIRRKRELLQALARGETTPEALERDHAISGEELDSWLRRFARGGEQALRVTRVRELRRREAETRAPARKRNGAP